MNKNFLKIAVAHHKDGFSYESDILLPIQVGKSLSQLNLDMQGDDENDNISYLNPYYCELTAIYWLWKNVDCNFYGLNHYRRYFTLLSPRINYKTKFKQLLKKQIFKKNKQIDFPVVEISLEKQDEIINELNNIALEMSSILTKENILVIPIKCELINQNVGSFFSDVLGQHHIDSLKEIIKDNFRDFEESFQESLVKSFLYPANMFVFDKITFNEYCNLVFGILEIHMQKHSKKDKSLENYSRISGYMAELITNAFIQSKINQGYQYKEFNILYIN